MKDIFTRYTTDVIATAAFGITCDSLKEKENEFYMAGKNSTTFGGFALLKIIAFVVIPRFCKMIGMTVIDKKITNFFRKLILSTMKVREEQNIIRPDMIHLLMQAKKGQLKHEAIIEDAGFATVQESNIGKIQEINKPALTDDDIIAQAFLFLFAGYDTASTMMSFMAYEVAINPDVQKKLQNEIDEVENFDYETVLKIKYLDMVVSESLRKWPPAALTERLCEKPYLIDTPNDNEAPLLVEKDVSIWIPVYSIQRDPKYFPDPERFDPERFSDENKHNINPFTYLPFGQGPRNCIGSRFALLEIKILFVHLLKKFDFIVVEKTQIPLKFDRKVFNLAAENGIWLGLKARN